MAVITGDFPPGPYEVTYKSASVGLMEGPIRHQQSVIALPIRASLWGQNIIDYIVQGGGVFAALVLKEWNTNTKALMHPFNASMGIFPEAGKLINPFFGELVLTALTGTPAATEGPVTRTYPICGLLPGHNVDVTLGPVERNVPVVVCALPEPDSTSKRPKYFTDT